MVDLSIFMTASLQGHVEFRVWTSVEMNCRSSTQYSKRAEDVFHGDVLHYH